MIPLLGAYCSSLLFTSSLFFFFLLPYIYVTGVRLIIVLFSLILIIFLTSLKLVENMLNACLILVLCMGKASTPPLVKGGQESQL